MINKYYLNDLSLDPSERNSGTHLSIFFYLGARPFGQYLPESSSSSAIPNHLLQWLAQRQSRITTTTEKTLQGLPLGDDGSGDGNLGSLEAVVSKDQQVKKPSLRSAPVAVDTLKGLTKLGSSPKPKLIQRPAYNPELARKDGEVESDNTTKGIYPVIT